MKRLFLLFSILSLVACSQQQPPPPAAPPAPPPAPPPTAQMNNFKVYFNSGSASLTSEGRQIVDAAAATAKSEPAGPIQVIGHTDTACSAALNQRLSRERAQNVVRELEQAGIPSNQINVSASGETDLAVQTPNEQAAAANRRVEIVLGAAATPPPPGPPGAPAAPVS